VIISTDRSKRPSDFLREPVRIHGTGFCPFCYGNEDKTPPEVDARRRDGGPRNGPGWSTRVVPNKFPALGIEGSLDRQGEGVFDKMSGIGAHEVIIESPEHNLTLGHLPEKHIVEVLEVYRDRMLDLKRDRRFKYILIFKNHGEAAGASLEHPHSQLIALPIVPKRVREEVDNSKTYWLHKERCIFCDIIRQELETGVRVIIESEDFVAVAPYAPRFPFETWLLPKQHGSAFENCASRMYEGLASLLKNILMRLDVALELPAYNYVIHTSPIGEETNDHYHWHMEMMPKLTKVAGFEWGTGFYINPTPPEESAQFLREAVI
jgi:UDPglucose--hexose-1-phosphate uridylyltransferase